MRRRRHRRLQDGHISPYLPISPHISRPNIPSDGAGKAPRAYSAATDAQIRRKSFFQLRCYALLLARGGPPLEMGSDGEIWRDLARSGEIWRASARRGVQTKTRRTLGRTSVQLPPAVSAASAVSGALHSRGVRTTPHQTVLPDFRLLDVDTR